MWVVLALTSSAFADKAPLDPDGDTVTDDVVSIQKDGTQLMRRVATATRRTTDITIDGHLTEGAWSAAKKVRYEWQESPDEGAKATGPTEFAVVYDDDALYVGVHATDPEPDKIGAVLHPPLLFRKVPQSDWIIILLDPPMNRRVAYGFAVNAAGVRLEFRSLAGVSDIDTTFAPVWDVKTSRDATGWSAEMRIPHSQTRVHGGAQTPWGFQVLRRVARKNERDYWSPFTFRSGQDVKGYGTLVIDDKLDVGRPLELRPYVRGGARLQAVAPGDLTHDRADPEYGAGLDLNYQAADALRVTATVNPDFGQVEADPSEVNLSDQETFFSERRPFFIQDNDLYRFTIGRGVESLFYTRRIGTRPHLTQAGSAPFVNEDATAPIYGALKLVGDFGGARLATLSALTGEATSHAQLDDGSFHDATIEPLTSYNVFELSDTSRGGSSELRAMGTATNRFLDGTGITTLHRQAYAGGAQYLHQFAHDRWALFAMAGGSYVEGSKEALVLTQTNSRRYMQRPDADHLTFDPNRTSLAGYTFNTTLRRLSGYWTGEVGVDARSPGFEVNDVGFQQTADTVDGFAKLQFLDSTIEKGPLREKSLALAVDSFSDFAPEALRQDAALTGHLLFRGNSSLDATAGYSHGVLDTHLLRGGPAVHGEDTVSGSLSYATDQSKDLALGLSLDGLLRRASDSRALGAAVTLRWNILSNLEVLIAPSLRRNLNNTQFVSSFTDSAGDAQYLLGQLRQWELRATTRVEYTLTPRMSVSFYGEPFVSAGRFARFLDAADPRAATYDARFHAVPASGVSSAMGQIDIDVDGDGLVDTSIPEPDFRVGSLVTNLVFRWEYAPGSFFHLIWSQARKGRELDGTLAPHDLGDVFTNDSVNVVLAKLSYWWNP